VPRIGTARAGSDAFTALGPFVEEQLNAGADHLYEATLRRMEEILLTRVLEYTGGNQLQAAKILGITRGSVRTKLRELGITITRAVLREEPQE
jgi:two-component system nitrogen regulation response regulator GlnG